MAEATAGSPNKPMRRVPLSMSHIGLYVHDLPTMEEFYTRVLGFTVTDRGKARGADIVFTSWDPKDHHQVALVSGRPKDLAFNHVNQISFRVTSLEDLQEIWKRVKDEPGVTDMRPMDRGKRLVALFWDPEGNRLEVFCDTQWYIEQPCVEDLDLSQPAEKIRASLMHSAALRWLQANCRIPGRTRRKDRLEAILITMRANHRIA